MSRAAIYRKLHPLMRNYQTAKWGFEGNLESCIYDSKSAAKHARALATKVYEAKYARAPATKAAYEESQVRSGEWLKASVRALKSVKWGPRLREPRSPRLLLALCLVARGVQRYRAAQVAGIHHQAVYKGLKRYPQFEAQRRASLIALLDLA